MTCRIGINQVSLIIPEAELVGIFCHIIDIFGTDTRNPLFNVEVSYIINGTLLPIFIEKSWTLYGKLCAIKSYCDSLKFEKDNTGKLTVIPIGIDKSPQTYYLKNEYINDFMIGYGHLLHILQIDPQPLQPPENYHDHFIPDDNLISQCQLIPKNKRDKNYNLNLPCYLWELPMYVNKYNEQITVDLINLFLRDCHDYDHQLLFNSNHYLRIIVRQDKPDADRYCYIYLRPISCCTFDSHKYALKSIPTSRLPCEIDFGHSAYFFHFPIIEWNNKYVEHIMTFD